MPGHVKDLAKRWGQFAIPTRKPAKFKHRLTWLKKRIPQIRTKRKRKAKLVKSNRPPKRQLQKLKQRLNVQRKRKRQSQRRNSQHLQPERPKTFLSQPKRLTSRRSSKP